MSDILKERIEERLEATGQTRSGASKAAGLGRTYLADFFKGRTGSLTLPKLEALAKVLQTTPQYLSGETFSAVSPQSARTLPVLGLAAGSVAGAHKISEEPIAYYPVQPGLVGVRDAYALMVTGESMLPLYKPRDPVFVNPHQPVRSGDIVVVQEERDGETYAWIKEFVRNTDDHVVTRQYNPASEVKIMSRYVVAVHRVLPYPEAMGI